MKTFIDKTKKFFTVKNSLIVVICILGFILVVQNINRYYGHTPSRNSAGSVTKSRSAGGIGELKLPGMGGGMGTKRLGN